MDEMNYNPEIFTLTDEEGNEHEFELMDVMELDGTTYYALVPYNEDPEAALAEDTELVILKGGEEDGVDFLTTIDNDEEYDRVGNIFLDRISEMLEGEFEDEEEEEE
ncbi:MAG: DUF1292 domain-containing protein [Oscillospiraceae bacterium]|nr:DUF1292 domain-containing protein [Oscillospiraceae bacterium]MBR4100758.1 DUF1292 domain-containing protein [Oscillospiraceae bacterium]MBR6618121.1 DUF1292 domain-containing protein [Oscillospiraceae bacterium]